MTAETLGTVTHRYICTYSDQSASFSDFKVLHGLAENLSAADLEMLAVVVSQADGCLYCLVARGEALSGPGRCAGDNGPPYAEWLSSVSRRTTRAGRCPFFPPGVAGGWPLESETGNGCHQ